MAKIIRDIFIGDFGISQHFGQHSKDYAKFGMVGHNGVDFKCPRETILIAGTQGLIKKVGYDGNGYGWFVQIWDNYQYLITIYAHLLKVDVSEGQWILAGHKIGTSNNTGNSTGAHLHFGAGDTNDKGERLNKNNGYHGWFDPLNKSRLKWLVGAPSTVEQAVRKANPGEVTQTVDVEIKTATIEPPKVVNEEATITVAPEPAAIVNEMRPAPPTPPIEGPFTIKDIMREQTHSYNFAAIYEILKKLLKKIFPKLSQ